MPFGGAVLPQGMKQRGTPPRCMENPGTPVPGFVFPGREVWLRGFFLPDYSGAAAPVLPMPLHLWFRGRTVTVFRFYPLSLLP